MVYRQWSYFCRRLRTVRLRQKGFGARGRPWTITPSEQQAIHLRRKGLPLRIRCGAQAGARGGQSSVDRRLLRHQNNKPWSMVALFEFVVYYTNH